MSSHRPLLAIVVAVTAAVASACSFTGQETPTDAGSATSVGPPGTPKPTTLPDAFQRVRDGVVRVQSYSCPPSQGSGFAISPTQIVTAAHVVEDATEVRVIHDGVATRATVVGIDEGRDVALLEVDDTLPTVLELSAEEPTIGENVAALGFTEGSTLSFKPGTVNGTDRKELIEGATRYGLIEIDSVANSGNSGGPVIGTDGAVVGVLDAGPREGAGQRLAVPAATVTDLVAGWRKGVSTAEEPGYPPCETLYDPEGDEFEVADLQEDPSSAALSAAHALSIYFNAVNRGDYATANSQLAEPMDLAAFREQVESSQDSEFAIFTQPEEDGEPALVLDFRSEQEEGRGPKGRPDETCTLWELRYRFTERDGMWLIDKAEPVYPGMASEPCDEGGD